MPAEDPGEAVEHFLHDVVVQSLSLQVFLPGGSPVCRRVQVDAGDCLLFDASLIVWER